MHKLITYLFLITIPFSGLAQIAEVRTYGGLFYDEGRQVMEITNGYIMVGSTSSTDNGNSDVAVIAINEDLTLNWNVTLGGVGADQGISICERFEGGYFVLGTTNAGDIGGYDIVLYAIDEMGNLEWEKYYGTGDWDLATKIVRGTASYFIAGTTYGNEPGGSDQLLLRINGNGDIVDSNNYDILPNAEMGDITFYDGFIYTVGTRTFDGGTPQGVVRKLSANGSMIWEDVRDSTSFSGLAITSSINGVTAGYAMTDITQDNTLDLFLVHFDPADGSEYWSFWANTPDTGNQYPRSLVWGSDEVLSASQTDLYGAGGLGALIVRSFFSNGFYLGGSIFGGSQDDEPYSIIKDSQDRIVVLGKTESYGSGSSDFYLVRVPDEEIVNEYDLDVIDYEGVIVTGLEEIENQFALPYPNPATETLYIPTTFSYTDWQIIDQRGAVVLTGTGSQANVSSLSSGMYLLTWGGEDNFNIAKVIVE